MHGQVTLPWADGDYTFRLTLSGLEEIENKFDKSIFVIVSDLGERKARSSEILEVLRVGLIGGGMAPVDALAKVRLYVDQRPLDENRDTAYAVALQGLMRVHSSEMEPPSGEADAAEESPSG